MPVPSMQGPPPVGSMGGPGPVGSMGGAPPTMLDQPPQQYPSAATLDGGYAPAQFSQARPEAFAPQQSLPQGSPASYQAGTPMGGPPATTMHAPATSMGLQQQPSMGVAPQTSMALPATQMGGPASGH